MKFSLDTERGWTPAVDSLIDLHATGIASTEDFLGFVKKVYERIEVFFGRHVALAKYINDNIERFDHLKKDKVVKTVMPKDLSIVSSALEEVNKALNKLQLGGKINVEGFCNGNAIKSAGITANSGHFQMHEFRNGHWGEGLKVNGINAPMVYNKTIDEFRWNQGARTYAERFCAQVNETNKNKIEDGAKRHFKDLSKAMKDGLYKDKVADEEKVVIGQITELNAVRDALISFYFKQLKTILSAAEDPAPAAPTMDDEYYVPKKPFLPNEWTGESFNIKDVLNEWSSDSIECDAEGLWSDFKNAVVREFGGANSKISVLKELSSKLSGELDDKKIIDHAISKSIVEKVIDAMPDAIALYKKIARKTTEFEFEPLLTQKLKSLPVTIRRKKNKSIALDKGVELLVSKWYSGIDSKIQKKNYKGLGYTPENLKKLASDLAKCLKEFESAPKPPNSIRVTFSSRPMWWRWQVRNAWYTCYLMQKLAYYQITNVMSSITE